VSGRTLGRTVECGWGWVQFVRAFRSSTTPHGKAKHPAAGLVIYVKGKTVYHLGDAGLSGDLELIAQRTPVDIALIPIGGHYTMDRHDAVVAAKLVGPPTVIPCHYNTFPLVAADPEAFKS